MTSEFPFSTPKAMDGMAPVSFLGVPSMYPQNGFEPKGQPVILQRLKGIFGTELRLGWSDRVRA